MYKSILTYIILVMVLFGCTSTDNNYTILKNKLLNTTRIIELSDGASKVLIVPEYQGRICASTVNEENTWGWTNIPENRSTLNGSEIHGEERIWLGPLGSKYSFFYGTKQPLHEDNWAVPESFNAEPFNLISAGRKQVILDKNIKLTNYLRHTITGNLKRKITILNKADVQKSLGLNIPDEARFVAYSTEHTLKNTDSVQWTDTTALATPWSLSSFKGSDKGIAFIPLKKDTSIYTYLSQLSDDRIRIENSTVLYKVDGKFRNKIGIPSGISKGIFACYQPEYNILRIVKFSETNNSNYFHSTVSESGKAYAGECIAIYNHGPMDYSIGSNNTFYELETMAPCKNLSPGESIKHAHEVYNFIGSEKALDDLLFQLFELRLEMLSF